MLLGRDWGCELTVIQPSYGMGLLLFVVIFGRDTMKKKPDPRATVIRCKETMQELHGLKTSRRC